MFVAHFFHGMYQVSVQQQRKETEYTLDTYGVITQSRAPLLLHVTATNG